MKDILRFLIVIILLIPTTVGIILGVIIHLYDYVIFSAKKTDQFITVELSKLTTKEKL